MKRRATYRLCCSHRLLCLQACTLYHTLLHLLENPSLEKALNAVEWSIVVD